VPSPTVDGAIDLSAVEAAAVSIGGAIRAHSDWPLVVMRTTVPPGTTEERVLPTLERESGRIAGSGLGLCANPEFLRELTALEDFIDPRVIVIGALDEASDRALRRLYAQWRRVPIHSMDLRTAEATKYTANLFNATKISFFNELEQVFTSL